MYKTARVIEGIQPHNIPFEEIFALNEPVVMKGLVREWPLVKAGLASPEEAMQYLLAEYSGKPATVYVGDPEIEARFGYNDSCTGFNYKAETMSLGDMFDAIKAVFGADRHPYYYVNSLMLDDGFPRLSADNNLCFDNEEFSHSARVAKVWIGTESRAAAHYDIPKNIACCAVGRRRFTLFPPDQVRNLYPGPFNPTPGGQVITMVDLKNPDFETYPRFRQALNEAVVADLEPGDALYYPSMWWHEVEAKDPFNIMINYWWMNSPRYMGNPLDALMHALLELRDRPDTEKEAWRALFDYYIFGSAQDVRAHLPQECHGLLATLDEATARRLRAQLQRSLNR